MTSPTLATVAAQFLQRPGLAKGTLKAYESTLMPFLAAYGSWPVDLLERHDVVEYLQGLTSSSKFQDTDILGRLAPSLSDKSVASQEVLLRMGLFGFDWSSMKSSKAVQLSNHK